MKFYLAPSHCIDNQGQPVERFFEDLEERLRCFDEVEIACYSEKIFLEWLVVNFQTWRLKDAQRGIEHEDFLDKVVLVKTREP
jgi:hypothetical protein